MDNILILQEKLVLSEIMCFIYYKDDVGQTLKYEVLGNRKLCENNGKLHYLTSLYKFIGYFWVHGSRCFLKGPGGSDGSR